MTTTLSFASEEDSASKRSLIVVPIGYYQPETSVALGVAGGFYFKSNDLKKISSISYSAIYTFKNQVIFHVAPKIYSKNKKYYYYTDFQMRFYPDVFYGIGAIDVTDGRDYVSRYVSLSFQPQRFINKFWSIGINYMTRYESHYLNYYNLYYESMYYWRPYFVQGIGVVTTYDSRDNLFYPEKGFFAKVSSWSSAKLFGSEYDISNINLDIRHYLPLGKKHIFAYQLYASYTVADLYPFQLIPTLGGSDKMRGFREGMFRNKDLILLQGEYRYPIYKRLKGVVFGGLGQVFDANNYSNDKLKISYGAGLRYRLNDARVHLRLDYGLTNYDTQGLYITATEAF